MRDYSYRLGQGGSNGRALSTNSATPASRPTEKGNSSCTCGGQLHKRLSALQACKDQECSLDVVTRTLGVFDLNVYALLDPGATLFLVTPYIAVQLSVSPKTLLERFLVSTLVGYPVIARRVYT